MFRLGGLQQLVMLSEYFVVITVTLGRGNVDVSMCYSLEGSWDLMHIYLNHVHVYTDHIKLLFLLD